VLYGHVFRNAMLIVIAGFPAVFIGVFFGGSLIIETIFSLDGLGRLAFEAAVARDYPVIFGTLFVFGLIGLVVEHHLGPDVCLDRPAHRLRNAGDLRRWRCPTRRPARPELAAPSRG
jgi:ABC-type microcin C transport system permease subunit YejB